tara:strand:+ start:909 stop:1667 length:759 start_codon:yes stop_codon:yes gene_type:complete
MQCLICSGSQLSDHEISNEDEKKKFMNNVFTFRRSTLGVILSDELPFCCFSSNPFFQPCLLVYLRHKTLNLLYPESGWEHYSCFQGYFQACCFTNYIPQNKFPLLSISLESLLCPGLSVSSTRFLLMDNYNLTLDPCDNRIIRLNNFLLISKCICKEAARLNKNINHFVKCIDYVTDCLYLSLIGCTITQINHEINYRRHIESTKTSFNYNPLEEILSSIPPPPVINAIYTSDLEYIAPHSSEMCRDSNNDF